MRDSGCTPLLDRIAANHGPEGASRRSSQPYPPQLPPLHNQSRCSLPGMILVSPVAECSPKGARAQGFCPPRLSKTYVFTNIKLSDALEKLAERSHVASASSTCKRMSPSQSTIVYGLYSCKFAVDDPTVLGWLPASHSYRRFWSGRSGTLKAAESTDAGAFQYTRRSAT